MSEGMSRREAEQAARRALEMPRCWKSEAGSVAVGPGGIAGEGLETGIPPPGKIARLCRHGHPHPGDRNRGQRGSFQRAQQRTVQAAALSACRAIGRGPDDCSRGCGTGGLLQRSPLSSSMYFTFAEQNRTFQSFGVWNRGTANVTGVDQPHEVHTVSVSDGVLQTLSVPPLLGRWLLPADQDPHGTKAVMLGYGYWQRRFGGDRSVIGRSIAIDAQPRESSALCRRASRW